VERLVEIIGALRADGAGIVYVSHRFDEVFRLADRVTVLRDGRRVVTLDRQGLDRPTLIRHMVGRDVSTVYPDRSGDARLERDRFTPILDVRNLSSRASGLAGISLSLRRCEILGLAGLVGSGRTELAETLFGLRPFDAGTILIDGVEARIESPGDAIARGLAYVPEDRRRHGVVLPMTVAANVSLASLPSVAPHGLIDAQAERRLAKTYVERLDVRTPSVATEVSALSGGNQQKVALARWLAVAPSILVLDEPTQGVDVGAKAEIHAIMNRLTAQGTAILMISSELPEVIGMSDRVAVMRHGRIVATLDREAATAETILDLALHERAS